MKSIAINRLNAVGTLRNYTDNHLHVVVFLGNSEFRRRACQQAEFIQKSRPRGPPPADHSWAVQLSISILGAVSFSTFTLHYLNF